MIIRLSWIIIASMGVVSCNYGDIVGRYHLDKDKSLTLTLDKNGGAITCYNGCVKGRYVVTYQSGGSGRVLIENERLAYYSYGLDKDLYGKDADNFPRLGKNKVEFNFETGLMGTVINFEPGSDTDLIKY